MALLRLTVLTKLGLAFCITEISVFSHSYAQFWAFSFWASCYVCIAVHCFIKYFLGASHFSFFGQLKTKSGWRKMYILVLKNIEPCKMRPKLFSVTWNMRKKYNVTWMWSSNASTRHWRLTVQWIENKFMENFFWSGSFDDIHVNVTNLTVLSELLCSRSSSQRRAE